MGEVLYLEENTEGRDFITGDIHGGYDLLIKGLLAVSFDPSKDRLICTGDMINRGPQSERFLDIISEPYVHSVCGNHEEYVLGALKNGSYKNEHALEGYFNLGMQWVLAQIGKGQKDRLIDTIESLPTVIEMQTSRGRVGVIHAEVPVGMDWDTFKDQLGSGNQEVIRKARNQRSRISARDHSGVQGIDRVFGGHTPQVVPQRLGNCFYIDTGTYKGAIGKPGYLTLANVNAHGHSIAPPMGVRAPNGKLNIVTDCPANLHAMYEVYIPSCPSGNTFEA